MGALWRCQPVVLALVLLVVVPVVRAAGPEQPVALGPDRGWISALALSPDFAHDGQAWAAAYGGRIFSTSDGAATWQASSAGETDPVVTALAVSSGFSSDRTAFAAADDGIFKSDDGGRTWASSSVGLNGRSARAIVLSQDYPQDHLAYVATNGGVYRSADGGTSWQPPDNDTVAVSALAAATGDSTLLLAGPSAGGLIVSTDGGRTWNDAPGFPSGHQVLAIALSPAFASDGTILAGCGDGLWKSVDRGSTWTQVGLTGDHIDAVVFSPAYSQDGAIFAGSSAGQGMFASADRGASWHALGALPFGFVQSLAVSPDFTTDRTLVVGTAGAGIFVSHDGGSSWSAADSGLHAAEVSQLSAAGSQLLLSGTGGADLWSNGVWQDLPLPTRFTTCGVLAGSQLWIGTQDQGLQVSRDGGNSWQEAALPDAAVSAVETAPNFASSGVALVADGYVYRTADGGQTWQQTTGMGGNDVRRFVFASQFASDHTVFAATVTHRLYRSSDGGASWALAATGLPSDQITDILTSPHFDTDATVYAATAGDGIYRSTDGGASWSLVAAQPPIAVVTALAQTPDGSLLAATEKGVFLNSGGTWRSLGTWNEYVTSLVIAPAPAGPALYAGTLGDGLWELPLPASPLPPTAPVPTLVPAPDPPPLPSPPAKAAPAATATSTPRPSATPVSRRLHPYLRVYPDPLLAGEPALLQIQGPGHGRVTVRLASRAWDRTFVATLQADGRAAFGFRAPSSTVTIVAVVHGRRQTTTVRLTVRVVRR